MNPELFSFAFVAGMIAFFNPCGIAMLPAYVSYYLGRNATEDDAPLQSWWSPGLRGLGLGATVSIGFFTVFIVVGAVFSLLGTAIAQYIPWAAAVFGVGLIVLGVLMVFGRAPTLLLPLPKIQAGMVAEDRGAFQNFRTFYLYGVGYATASVGCTIPIFLVVLLQSFAGGLLSGVINFGAYALGMTVMMLVLSLVTAYSKDVVRQYVHRALPYVTKVSGVVLVGAGAYLIWYQIFYSRIIDFL